MAKSFKEIGEKAEALIEQGRAANQKVMSCQARVVSSSNRVDSARRMLAAASETDEDGNPKGDVESAQIQLSMAENQLAASQRALSSAQGEAAQIKRQKNAHVQEIEKHNRVEKSNLEKLRRLKSGPFSADSAALTEGIAQRLNEAENARVALLQSMGIEATADYVTVGNGGESDSGWRGGGFAALDTTGQTQNYHGGGSEGYAPGGGIATPVGGGLNSESMNGPFYSGSNETENEEKSLGAVQGGSSSKRISHDDADGLFPEGDGLQEKCRNYINRVVGSESLSTDQKMASLNMMRVKLLAVANSYSSQMEAECIKEHVKVKKLSALERQKLGERYINNILDVYRDELIDRGVVSISALDATINELRRHYTKELEKDLQGQENELYADPNYEELIKRINNRRPPISSVAPGDRMPFEKADSGHVNPYIGTDFGYSINCQSCVVVFEARERGYDVQVLPWTKGSALDLLSRDPSLAWIDPKTGKHPEYIYDSSLRTPEAYLSFVNDVIKPGNRYTIQFYWKGRNNGGHIVNIDRTPEGVLRIKDNQRGLGEKSEWIGENEVLRYLARAKYENTSFFGNKSPCVPRLLRIDNMDFDYSIVNNIMKGA